MVYLKCPRDLKRVPKGWTMPSLEDPLIIGVPGNATSENLVKITSIKNSDQKTYSGFCIRVFEEVQRILGYDIPSKYVEFNGTYDNLVANVANKVINQPPTFFFFVPRSKSKLHNIKNMLHTMLYLPILHSFLP